MLERKKWKKLRKLKKMKKNEKKCGKKWKKGTNNGKDWKITRKKYIFWFTYVSYGLLTHLLCFLFVFYVLLFSRVHVYKHREGMLKNFFIDRSTENPYRQDFLKFHGIPAALLGEAGEREWGNVVADLFEFDAVRVQNLPQRIARRPVAVWIIGHNMNHTHLGVEIFTLLQRRHHLTEEIAEFVHHILPFIPRHAEMDDGLRLKCPHGQELLQRGRTPRLEIDHASEKLLKTSNRPSANNIST